MKILCLLAALSFIQIVTAHAGSIYDIKVTDIDGKETTLGAYKGKVLLIVNVASRCGFTKQYTALEAIYEKFKDQVFNISRDYDYTYFSFDFYETGTFQFNVYSKEQKFIGNGTVTIVYK